MKIVLDRNSLQPPLLDQTVQLMSASGGNIGVITPFLITDIFADGNTANVRAALRVLASFGHRLIVLKSMMDCARVDASAALLPDAFIDRTASADFPRYCAAASSYERGFTEDILKRSAAKFDDNTTLLKDSPAMRAAMKENISRYHHHDYKLLRQGRISAPFRETLRDDILSATKRSFQDLGFSLSEIPAMNVVQHTFPFRFALALTALQLYWAKVGNMPSRDEKVRNYVTDMSYVAFATYFDLLQTNDADMRKLYGVALQILKNIFSFWERDYIHAFVKRHRGGKTHQ